MIETQNQSISMVEGEFGEALEINFTDMSFSSRDTLALRIFKTKGTTIIEKTYSDVSNNQIILRLTQQESNKLSPGEYRYEIDWYQDGFFQITLLRNKLFRVLEKRP